MPSPSAAAEVARELLEPLGQRWQHTVAVAARAADLSLAVPAEDSDLLIVAAWWHDLGYAPDARQTGMHQIDGASYLAGLGYSERLCALVAHHSAAECEAEQRGLLSELRRWQRERSATADALWMADMTTGPSGEPFDYTARLAEILDRYDSSSVVGRAMTSAQPLISAAISRTTARLQAAGSGDFWPLTFG
ncbi:HD domain-containing protein [Pseudonocardia sp. ICBG1142]|uniref:HD domain-containing protein n=1 Tax=Pseudonocardia sp. ICBG1142 TaxID=2846760 RepID=UPI001CF70693|nr:HD domain-containing protein [Pseudonocardia sp. ICBG1142]